MSVSSGEKWVRDEVGAYYSQCAGNINVPESSLTRLVDRRDELTLALARCRDAITGYKHTHKMHPESVLATALENAKSVLEKGYR